MPSEDLPNQLADDDSIIQAESAEPSPATVETILHESTPPRSTGPWAFGMKSLLITTGVAAVQFALMSYLGPLMGLLIGLAVCALTMVVIIVIAVMYGRSVGEQWMDRLDHYAIRVTVVIVLLFVGTIVAGGGQIIYYTLAEARLAWDVQRDLGFSYTKASVLKEDMVVEVIAIQSVTAGGPFDLAGVQSGDVIVSDQTPRSLLKMLGEQRGQPVDLNLASGATGAVAKPLENCPQRVVTVNVPP